MELDVNKYLHCVLCCILNQRDPAGMNNPNARAQQDDQPLVGARGQRNGCYNKKFLNSTVYTGVILLVIAVLVALALGAVAVVRISSGELVHTQYVRWGSKDCPNVPGTTMLYNGYTAGHNATGGGSNYLCLPYPDRLIQYKDKADYGNTPVSFTVGTEYRTFLESSNFLDAACAVCIVSSRSHTTMIPARYDCLDSWTKEYDGYLMTDISGSLFECVDSKMDSYRGSKDIRDNLAYFFHVAADQKTELPNSYDINKVLSCVVCTK